MKMAGLVPFLWNLQKNEPITVYRTNETKIIVTRTDKISPRDFGVGLIIKDKSGFRPTHVRLLFDLHLKRRGNPEEAEKLFYALEKVYEGEDPEKLTKNLDIDFKMKLDDARTNLYYAQLLMMEQEFNYIPLKELQNRGAKVIKTNKQGKPTRVLVKINGEPMEKGVAFVTPPRDFLMRFIRWIARGDIEDIDTIITCAVRNRSPRVLYKKRLFDDLQEPAPWVLDFLRVDK